MIYIVIVTNFQTISSIDYGKRQVMPIEFNNDFIHIDFNKIAIE